MNVDAPRPPKVSVVMPVHDGAATLRAALDSVFGQTLDDFELVVVDDGSTDDTAHVLAAVGDERMRVLRNERNLGIARSLQRGLDAARGALVARLDADDRWLPDYLARMCAAAATAPDAALLACWTQEVDANGRPVGASEPPAARGFVEFELTHRNSVYPSATLLRRDAVLAAGGLRERFAVAEDHDLWTRLLMRGERFVVVPQRLVQYRRGDLGVTASTPTGIARSLGLDVRKAYCAWLLDRALRDDEVAAFWDVMMWRALPDDLHGPRLRDALGLAGDVRRAAFRRFARSGSARRAIRRRIAATFLHHVCERSPTLPHDAWQLLAAAVANDPWQLLRVRPWRLALGVLRGLARTKARPAGTIPGRHP